MNFSGAGAAYDYCQVQTCLSLTKNISSTNTQSVLSAALKNYYFSTEKVIFLSEGASSCFPPFTVLRLPQQPRALALAWWIFDILSSTMSFSAYGSQSWRWRYMASVSLLEIDTWVWFWLKNTNQSRGWRIQFITTKIAGKIQPRTMLAFLKIADICVVVVRSGRADGRIFQSNAIEISVVCLALLFIEFVNSLSKGSTEDHLHSTNIILPEDLNSFYKWMSK